MKKFILLLLIMSTFMNADTLIVDVFECPPLIIRSSDGEYSGLEIDMWKSIARDNKFEYKFNYVDTFSNLFDRLEKKESDVALAGITINYDRESRIDFTHSHFTTGLGVLVHAKQFKLNEYITYNFKFYLVLLFKLIPFIIGWLCYIYILALIMWYLEIGNEMFNDGFKKGFPDAKFFVHVVISSTGFGNQIPISKWGRRLTIVLMYSGIGFMFPLITGKITSEMTNKPPYVSINSIEDLKDKKISSMSSTTSYEYAKDISKYAEKFRCTSNFALIKLLKINEVDAVIYDKPMLIHIAKGNDKYRVLDGHLNKEDYGIAVQDNSTLTKQINESILYLKENGTIDNLKKKWL